MFLVKMLFLNWKFCFVYKLLDLFLDIVTSANAPPPSYLGNTFYHFTTESNTDVFIVFNALMGATTFLHLPACSLFIDSFYLRTHKYK